MDYLSLLEKQPGQKAALVTDSSIYTYAELLQSAKQIRRNITGEDKYIFIHESTIARQLIKFLAYSGTAVKPVIATEISREQQFSVGEIPEKACMGVMTSGSTGRSKLLWRSYNSWADFFPVQNKVFGINHDTVIFCQGSLAFTGNLNMYLSVLAEGATVIATEKFRPKHWLELIQRYNVNSIYLIPAKLLLLTKFPGKINEKVCSIISGSQSMGKKEAERIKSIYPKAELTLYYGASELNYITYIKDSEMDEHKDNVGHPFAGVELFISNEEIFVNTAYGIENIALPYSLKDRGYLDKQGNLHFLGRIDDVCNINGIKISSRRVEQAILNLDGINEASVLAVHKNDTDILAACIGSEKAVSKQSIIKLLREYIADYEMPKNFYFFRELPKNESGKVDKLKLQEYIK